MTIRGASAAAAGTAAFLLLLLAGCADDTDNGPSGAFGSSAWSQIAGMVGTQLGSHNDTVTLEQAAAIPYATIGVRQGDSPEMMLVLAADEAGDHLWTSKARAALTTRFGRVVRTSGLPVNIDGVNYNGDEPVETAARSGQAIDTIRYVDFWDLNRFSVVVRCVTVSKGPESVTILGKAIATTRVEQACESPTIDWQFTDIFWVGTSGLVWKSIQHYHPNYEPLTLEILRPPVRIN